MGRGVRVTPAVSLEHRDIDEGDRFWGTTVVGGAWYIRPPRSVFEFLHKDVEGLGASNVDFFPVSPASPLNFVETRFSQCGAQGHLSMSCFARDGEKYDLVKEDDDRSGNLHNSKNGGGGGRGGGGGMRGVRREVCVSQYAGCGDRGIGKGEGDRELRCWGSVVTGEVNGTRARGATDDAKLRMVPSRVP